MAPVELPDPGAEPGPPGVNRRVPRTSMLGPGAEAAGLLRQSKEGVGAEQQVAVELTHLEAVLEICRVSMAETVPRTASIRARLEAEAEAEALPPGPEVVVVPVWGDLWRSHSGVHWAGLEANLAGIRRFGDFANADRSQYLPRRTSTRNDPSRSVPKLKVLGRSFFWDVDPGEPATRRARV